MLFDTTVFPVINVSPSTSKLPICFSSGVVLVIPVGAPIVIVPSLFSRIYEPWLSTMAACPDCTTGGRALTLKNRPPTTVACALPSMKSSRTTSPTDGPNTAPRLLPTHAAGERHEAGFDAFRLQDDFDRVVGRVVA